MVDYREIASKAKVAHEAKMAEQARTRAEESAARSTFVDAAVAFLDMHVVPMLERAQTAFAADGIESQITKLYEAKNQQGAGKPAISFRCLGPKRASDNWQFPVPPVFIVSDGKSIFVGAGQSAHDREAREQLGQADVGQTEALVTRAIERAIASYYKELERNQHTLGL